MNSWKEDFAALRALTWRAVVFGMVLLHAGCADREYGTNAGVLAARALSRRSIDEVRFTNCTEVLAWRAAHPMVFSTKVIADGWRFEFDNRTPFCTACLEDRGAQLSDTAFQARLAALEHSTLLVLRATPMNGQLPLDEAAVQKGVMRIVAGDTIPCAFAHQEVNPNVVPFQTFILGFDQVRVGTAEHLLVREGLIGNRSPLVLHPKSLAGYIKALERGVNSDRS